MSQPPYILVATPTYGGLATTSYITSLLTLQTTCLELGVGMGVRFFSDSLVTRARNELVRQFLAHEHATHLMFIDADIGFSPDQVLRLLKFNVDVAAGAYPLKEVDWAKAERAIKAGRSNVQTAALHYVLAWEDSTAITARDGFAPVKRIGTGFLLIRRNVIERMCDAYPELRHIAPVYAGHVPENSPRWALFDCMIDPETKEYLSEDYAFCRRWRDLGGEIWLDTFSKLNHTGPVTFTGDLQAQFIRPE
ncbi:MULTISPECIES: hypothetical protein [Bradyrhizobium]|uniref:Glycosyltransferase n=1 Tax=Bradyrhizobium uaiense TaxID=2594946 RepID=A0A6P1BCM4_9BRAD|nr:MULTISPECIES: hypothetical protein [Bradyrhizobium]MCC8963603.1 hypothetical protein [Bradyrhizobium oropedii]MCC8980642.1 hypothetical protein [Bradyrhizobium acaciae]NEU96187.1 hypothetical protein [Bradyrhizobium uaiense]